MIAKILKRKNAAGLLGYLFGPGHANEHYNQQIIAGSSYLEIVYGGRKLDKTEVKQAYRELARNVLWLPEIKDGNYFHIVLSASIEDGILGAEKWQQIAYRYVKGLGIDDVDAQDYNLAHWVAVHHGQGLNGNDHIHLVVSRRRLDGTKLFIGRRGKNRKPVSDWVVSNQVCREIEKEFGLQEIKNGYSQPSWKRGEQAKASRAAGTDIEPKISRETLEEQVRGIAASSFNEIEFVAKLRQKNLWIRPRYAKNDSNKIVGYAVALPPKPGEKPIWYGGRTLGNDLSLTRLRNLWQQTSSQEVLALELWKTKPKNIRADSSMVGSSFDEITKDLENLAGIYLHEKEFAIAAGDISGLCFELSNHYEGELKQNLLALGRAVKYVASPKSMPLIKQPIPRPFAKAAALAAKSLPPKDKQLIKIMEAIDQIVSGLITIQYLKNDTIRLQKLSIEARQNLERIQNFLTPPETPIVFDTSWQLPLQIQNPQISQPLDPQRLSWQRSSRNLENTRPPDQNLGLER